MASEQNHKVWIFHTFSLVQSVLSGSLARTVGSVHLLHRGRVHLNYVVGVLVGRRTEEIKARQNTLGVPFPSL